MIISLPIIVKSLRRTAVCVTNSVVKGRSNLFALEIKEGNDMLSENNPIST